MSNVQKALALDLFSPMSSTRLWCAGVLSVLSLRSPPVHRHRRLLPMEEAVLGHSQSKLCGIRDRLVSGHAMAGWRVDSAFRLLRCCQYAAFLGSHCRNLGLIWPHHCLLHICRGSTRVQGHVCAVVSSRLEVATGHSHCFALGEHSTSLRRLQHCYNHIPLVFPQ